jgi:hypothetical protein
MVEVYNVRGILLRRAKTQLMINITSLITLALVVYLMINNAQEYLNEWIGLGILFGIFPVWNMKGIILDLLSCKVKPVQGLLINKCTIGKGGTRGGWGLLFTQLCLVDEDNTFTVELHIPARESSLLEIGCDYKIYISRYSNMYIKSVRRIITES